MTRIISIVAAGWRSEKLGLTRRNRLGSSLGFSCAMAKTPSPALRAPSPPTGARGKKKPRFETGMNALSRHDQLFTKPAAGPTGFKVDKTEENGLPVRCRTAQSPIPALGLGWCVAGFLRRIEDRGIAGRAGLRRGGRHEPAWLGGSPAPRDRDRDPAKELAMHHRTPSLGRVGFFVLLVLPGMSPLASAAPPGEDRPANRLARETSPYLLLHAHNPVDWYPWGPEAFARAKAENKPIFLSVGYSSCYWCHVMERESFMDDEIAKVLNENFVCIKVDREERPDVDQIYMTAPSGARARAAGRCRCS